MDQKRTKEFLELIKTFQFTDLLAFAQILGVQEEDNFVNFTTNILVQFNSQNRLKRKQLLKLARDVSKANKELRGGA